jgi:hypothetical protein
LGSQVTAAVLSLMFASAIAIAAERITTRSGSASDPAPVSEPADASVDSGTSSTPQAAARPTLEADLLPLLKARCVKCHGPLKPKARLSLASSRAIARGSENGPIVEPGSLDASALWDQIARDEMPPKPEEPLAADEKALIRLWIEQGATGLPAIGTSDPGPSSDHWAFANASSPPPPDVRDPSRLRTPIDRFIQKTLEDRGLAIGPEADRGVLIRRVSIDLLGVPPTPEEIEVFRSDDRPDAYERMVDRVLASPRYGERWGKYWLDAAGYADSNGYFSADSDRPLAYRYRDYVIRAFKEGRPLDRIVREQLAGDELVDFRRSRDVDPASETIDAIEATHFLRNSQDGTGESDGNPDEVRADKYAVLDGTIQILGSSLFGLTFQCARCHDHKFEPITQAEYYQLQSILFPAFDVGHWVKPNDRVVAVAPRALRERWEAQEKAIDQEVARLKADRGRLKAESQKSEANPQPKQGGEEQRPVEGEGQETKAEPEASNPDRAARLASQIEAIEKEIQAAESRRRPEPGRIAWVSDVSAGMPNAPLLKRGNPATPGEPVPPGVPAILIDPDNRYEPHPPGEGSDATGRRLALARWLTQPGSRPAALLARLLVNRIWQGHFGEGLVSTTDNLGYSGSPPSHPELLEFLASELARSGWDARALHRLILTSAVYRQSSTSAMADADTDVDAAALAARVRERDPDGRLLSRYPLRRLDAEALRDAMLFVSGELDDRAGGPYIPTHRRDSGEVVVDEKAVGSHRRSVYLQQRRTQVASLLEVFDAPSIVTNCTRRLPSTIPLQSLSLLNSDFVVNRSRALADRVRREVGDDPDAIIQRVFLRTIGREPAPDEYAAAHRFLDTQPHRYPDRSPDDALRQSQSDLCQMLLASNSFLYIE